MMSEGDPIGYVVIEAGNVERHVRVEPIEVGEKIPLTANETVVNVLPAGETHD